MIDYKESIQRSGLTIYDPITVGDPELWIPSPELTILLTKSLAGISLEGLALRTRSKVVKEAVCKALGYPVPKSFIKTQPRFPGQCFDTYVQKSNNLQVWNEELSPTRRYVIIQVSEKNVITKVKVITGDTLASLDATGTLTSKYQASCIPSGSPTELISETDTSNIVSLTSRGINLESTSTPVTHPMLGELLPIKEVFERLSILVGMTFVDKGYDQERNRGEGLHRLVCQALGYINYQDNGQFPDVRHQLIEVKLQTSPTIDLGIGLPNSETPIDVPQIDGNVIRHSDVRYAIFYARTDGIEVTITHFMLVTGSAFFNRFPQFGGKVLNKKLQIRLPGNFFEV
jgi:hypothetical protein